MFYLSSSAHSSYLQSALCCPLRVRLFICLLFPSVTPCRGLDVSTNGINFPQRILQRILSRPLKALLRSGFRSRSSVFGLKLNVAPFEGHLIKKRTFSVESSSSPTGSFLTTSLLKTQKCSHTEILLIYYVLFYLNIFHISTIKFYILLEFCDQHEVTHIWEVSKNDKFIQHVMCIVVYYSILPPLL